MIVLVFLTRGLVLSIVALGLLLLLRRAPGATRHATVSLALLLLLALPGLFPLFVERGLPHASVSLPRSAMVGFARVPGSSSRISERATVRNAQGDAASTRPLQTTSMPSTSRLPSASTVLFAIYFLIALLLALRLAFGWIATGRLIRTARRVHGLEESGRSIRVSDRIEVPLALWWGRGVILLPRSHEAWTSERREAVLRHEEAHLRRGDLLSLFVGQLALAIHWPNPLVWRLVATARRSAEDAADDAVLLSGLAPDRYSAHLLELARMPRTRTPLLALPIARRSDLNRRIRRMLHPRYRPISRRSRGLTTVAALAVASVVFGITGTLAIGFSAQGAGSSLPSQVRAESWAPDVREGRSIAATPANGFVGTLSDGLKARVTMVYQSTPRGMRCWTPDGRPTSTTTTRFASLLRQRPHMRVIVTRFDATSPNAEAALGSGTRPGGPSVIGFAGGDTKRERGRFECYSLIEIPKEDAATASFTLAVNSEGWKPSTTFTGAVGSKPGTRLMREIAVDYPAIGRPLLRNKAGSVLEDAEGRQRTREISGLYRVGFTVSMDERWRQFRILPVDRQGRTLQPVWTDAGQRGDTFLRSFYFKVRPDDVREIRVESQAWRHVEVVDVAMRPKP